MIKLFLFILFGLIAPLGRSSNNIGYKNDMTNKPQYEFLNYGGNSDPNVEGYKIYKNGKEIGSVVNNSCKDFQVFVPENQNEQESIIESFKTQLCNKNK